jgi:hypothetical protein
MIVDREPFSKFINDYYGKNYKISGHNKQMTITFLLNNDKNVILRVNSDLKYKDIRNNINIKLTNISRQELNKCTGAFVGEETLFC